MKDSEYLEFRVTLLRFSNATQKRHGGYAYQAGYYEGLLLQMLEVATEDQRNSILRQLKRTTETEEQALVVEHLTRDDETAS